MQEQIACQKEGSMVYNQELESHARGHHTRRYQSQITKMLFIRMQLVATSPSGSCMTLAECFFLIARPGRSESLIVDACITWEKSV